MLAFQSPEAIEAVIAEGLEPRTTHTRTDPEQLLAALREVRQRGVAIEDEENEIGVRCIAAPIWDSNYAVVGAIGVAGPVQRLPRKRMNAIASEIVTTARSISARLGYRVGTTRLKSGALQRDIVEYRRRTGAVTPFNEW